MFVEQNVGLAPCPFCRVGIASVEWFNSAVSPDDNVHIVMSNEGYPDEPSSFPTLDFDGVSLVGNAGFTYMVEFMRAMRELDGRYNGELD